MSEAMWLTSNDPLHLYDLPEVRAATTNRRRAFLALAICRRWLWLPVELSPAVNGVEGYAEGLSTQANARTAFPSVFDAVIYASRHFRDTLTMLEAATNDGDHAFNLVRCACEVELTTSRMQGEVWHTRELPAIAQIASLMREIIGNPFRPAPCDPSWRTTDVMLLAQGIYADRDFGAMPILADALQDAGCDNPDILDHCRDTSLTHVRGCWVVDLVLGKT